MRTFFRIGRTNYCVTLHRLCTAQFQKLLFTWITVWMGAPEVGQHEDLKGLSVFSASSR